MKKSKLIQIVREEIHSVITEAQRAMVGAPYRNTYASGVIPRFEDDDEDVGEVEETDIRKKYGDQRIDNPKTGNAIKLRTALKAKKGSDVYRKAKQIYNRLKDQEET